MSGNVGLEVGMHPRYSDSCGVRSCTHGRLQPDSFPEGVRLVMATSDIASMSYLARPPAVGSTRGCLAEAVAVPCNLWFTFAPASF